MQYWILENGKMHNRGLKQATICCSTDYCGTPTHQPGLITWLNFRHLKSRRFLQLSTRRCWNHYFGGYKHQIPAGIWWISHCIWSPEVPKNPWSFPIHLVPKEPPWNIGKISISRWNSKCSPKLCFFFWTVISTMRIENWRFPNDNPEVILWKHAVTHTPVLKL